MSTSGGAYAFKHSDDEFTTQGAMAIDAGVGTSPDGAFILGGLFRLTPVFQQGVDLALVTRAATRGFQTGPFGVALDVGAYARPWGPGSLGFQGGLVLGGPLGLQLSGQGMVGTEDALSFGAFLGVDFLRLVLFREDLTDWWTNPLPPQERRRDDEPPSPSGPPSSAIPGTSFSF